MGYSMNDVLPDYIGTPARYSHEPGAYEELCAEYGGYRPGDECPARGHDGMAICEGCKRHVALDERKNIPAAMRVWDCYGNPAYRCPACVAEYGDELERCGVCGDSFHVDLETVHDRTCEGCRS